MHRTNSDYDRYLVGDAVKFVAIFALIIAALFLLPSETRADTPPPTVHPDVQAWSDYALVDALDLQGAVNTTGLSPEDYLVMVGHVIRTAPPPAPTNQLPIGGALGNRIYCIERIESNHGLHMYNPIPVGRSGEHAQGWLGYLPSTARSVNVTIGNRQSEWNGAALMIAQGRGREFYGIGAGIC